jgi:hypothetical protein
MGFRYRDEGVFIRNVLAREEALYSALKIRRY